MQNMPHIFAPTTPDLGNQVRMRRGRELLGLSVVGQEDGRRLGNVRDLFFDHDTDELLALVIAEKDLFGLIDAQIVPWREIVSIGGDVILARNSASIIKLRDDPRVREMAQRETVLSGTAVMSQSGEKIGTLADMFIDETTGRVLGYEVSNGFLSDTLRGKKFVPAPPGLAIGRDAAIAPPSAEAQIKK
jgi:uncharacterized protein YrrD